MTQEEKNILLKDLCARLPYRPLVQDEDAGICLLQTYMVNDLMFENPSLSIKPYLRPMSSMTEEEKEEYRNECNKVLSMPFKINGPYPIVDWLNAHYFDHQGLIEKGLALEAPEDMY